MNSKLETSISAILAACAVAITVSYLNRSAPASRVLEATAVPADDWENLVRGDLRLGREGAPVTVVEFGDFQCPFCRVFHDNLDRLVQERRNEIALVYYHFPLDIHPAAEEAARAATCAARQGALAGVMSALFEMQDSLAVKPWSNVASRAGVADITSFNECMADPRVGLAVRSDKEYGEGLGVTGTPTVFINGWRLPFAPSLERLREIVDQTLAGRDPFERP